MNGNWLIDIHHACAAAGYYNAMLTETPLKVLMTSGHVQLDKKHGIRKVSRGEDVIDHLRQL